MDPRNRTVAVRLDLEVMEGRVVPGALAITPVGLPRGDQYIVFVPSAAEAGLAKAQAHTGGVVQLLRGN